MTQNSLTVHAHFRRGLAKTIHSRVSRTTSATQRVPEQRLPAAVRAHSRSSLFHCRDVYHAEHTASTMFVAHRSALLRV